MSEILLQAEGITVSFGSGRPAVDDISIEIRAGQITALLGESGSGKTVLSRTIAGMPSAQAQVGGRSLFDGLDLLRLGARGRRRILGSRIAFIPQDPVAALDPMRRVGGQIVEVLVQHRRAKGQAARRRMIELLELVAIHDPARVAAAYPHELSGGMRQRVSVAIALACEPELIIADEASSALDASVGARVVDLLVDLRDRTGSAIVFITHDIGVAARIARDADDRVAVMISGRLVELGRAHAVLGRPGHPYTTALLAAEPSRDVPRGELAVVPAQLRTQEWGPLKRVGDGHWVAEPRRIA